MRFTQTHGQHDLPPQKENGETVKSKIDISILQCYNGLFSSQNALRDKHIPAVYI